MDLSLNLLDLEKTPASDVKAKGWPDLMRKVAKLGAVVVTNHNHPQAVVVSAEEYQRLVAQATGTSEAAQRAQSLKRLQNEFDAHLAVLNDGQALSKALNRPARRGLKIIPGKSL
ncbi:MAG TPA: type II toxin-antitoxin system prevent-host-death family antitoxin [Stenotrophomonas sp.]|jgi:prevent-host-death family protein|uniref:type II toxin-antitoxin system prevent-host-death family antitoxin n=1 Tax=Stenotrophomonas pigmentata TaxID=3055080 RepID=UPI0026F1D220|nr:type II toxin-antitoxin system prevent-host-death family antitoxin [Stenotrophomonas sp. 610A2]